MPGNRIVAVGLLTQAELRGLGSAFDRAWPVEDARCFAGLLEAIEEADRLRHERYAGPGKPEEG